MSEIKETSQHLKSLKIFQPSIILDSNKVLSNIEQMASKARKSGVVFRPHFKTHQSAEIGSWFRDFGVEKITVSSLDMALYFAENDWNNITVAFPVNILEIEKINMMAGDLQLNLMLDSVAVATALEKQLKYPVGVWIKIDVGYGRAGIAWNKKPAIRELYQKICRSHLLEFEGILTHSGHVYQAKSTSEIRDIYGTTVQRLDKIKTSLRSAECQISIGDTPSCALVDDFSGLDEIRPGNFVFFDLMQENLGVCSAENIAVAVACPIVAKYADRRELVIFGGGIHFSKESLIDEKGEKIFGYLTWLENGRLGPILKNASVVALSQEHGIIRVDDEMFDQLSIANMVLIYPVHSCLTANLYDEYMTIQGNKISRL
ncbi:alanine racemase [candidate division KSB1 bacterium]|nr:alanine racemase [candidate division KSB1 bacterium]